MIDGVKTIKYDVVVVHYGEVTLKRGKRGFFERTLVNNLRMAVGLPVLRLQGRCIVELSQGAELDDVLHKIGKVFGVAWYAPAIRASNIEELEKRLAETLRVWGAQSIKIETRRSDKSFPMTSLEISRRIGKYLASTLGIRMDLKNADKRIFIEVTESGIYASFQKLRGPGGLPVGGSGKVLGLFSGKTSSAIACWYMMKRGCIVDFLHVFAEDFFRGEGYTLLRKLLEYSLRSRLYLVPMRQFAAFSEKFPMELREIVFKLYLLKLGEAIARRGRHLGLVWGYNAGASLVEFDEFCAVTRFRTLPSYAPLISINELELRERAGDLGIEFARDQKMYFSPGRRVLEKIWKEPELDAAVDSSLRSMEIYGLKVGEEPKKIWPR